MTVCEQTESRSETMQPSQGFERKKQPEHASKRESMTEARNAN